KGWVNKTCIEVARWRHPPAVHRAPYSPLARRVEDGFAGAVRSCCPSEASSGPAGESVRSEGSPKGRDGGARFFASFLAAQQERKSPAGASPGRSRPTEGTIAVMQQSRRKTEQKQKTPQHAAGFFILQINERS